MEDKNSYQPGEITLRLASEDVERGFSPILNAVLSGIFSGDAVSERFNACLNINLQWEDNPHAEKPLLVHPGFPEFCRNLFTKFPGLVFVVNEGDPFDNNDFYKSAVIAASCRVSAVEQDGNGFIGVMQQDYEKAAREQLRIYSEVLAKCPDKTGFGADRVNDIELYLFP